MHRAQSRTPLDAEDSVFSRSSKRRAPPTRIPSTGSIGKRTLRAVVSEGDQPYPQKLMNDPQVAGRRVLRCQCCPRQECNHFGRLF